MRWRGVGLATFCVTLLAACGAGPGGFSTLGPSSAPSQPSDQPVYSPAATQPDGTLPTDTPDDASTPTPSDAGASQQPVTVSGDGLGTSDVFELAAGDYSVSYDLTGACDYSADLDDSNGGVVEKLFISSSGGGSGSTTFPQLDAGSYYVDMQTGAAPDCPWSVTISP